MTVPKIAAQTSAGEAVSPGGGGGSEVVATPASARWVPGGGGGGETGGGGAEAGVSGGESVFVSAGLSEVLSDLSDLASMARHRFWSRT